MIINLKKYLFVGVKEDLADFFIRAQEEGFIEFISDKKKKSRDLPDPVKRMADAIKILRKQPVKDTYLKGGDAAYAEEVTNQILSLQQEIEKLEEEKRFLEAEISRVAPFGDFSMGDIDFLEKYGKKKIQFYCVKTSKAHEVDVKSPLLYVGTDYDLDYYIGIHKRATSYPGMIEMQVDKTAKELKNHLLFVEETLHQVEAELKGFAGHIEFLKSSLLDMLDIHMLEKSQSEVDFPIEGAVFSIEGWVPENQTDKLLPLIEGKALFFEPIAVEEEDKVPTYMENEKTNQIGEDLVRIYDIPAATDKDPSGWVIWAFALFFALIIADGGYGMLFLGLAFFLKKKFPHIKAGGKRLLKLFFILASSCIVWGVLTTSFFGMQFSPKDSISKFSILNHIAAKKATFHKEKNDKVHKYWVEKYPSIARAKTPIEAFSIAKVKKGKVTYYEMLDDFTDNILLEFSLLIGVIHISLSLLRYARRNWANIGWVAFAIGGYLYFPVTLKATSMIEFLGWMPKDTAATIGIQLLYGGMGFAVVMALFQKKLKGLSEITQVIQIFADILSYLRLYALALASTIMARTFNEMGANIGLVIGSVIILLGHSVNLLLGTMGGIIHGLRLNFIEWYHYSFEGEGRLFNPLRKLKMHLKEE